MKKYLHRIILVLWVLYVFLRYSQGYISLDIPFLEKPSDEISSTASWTLYISPYRVQDHIVDLLSSTKYTLRMREYSITMKEIISVVKNKAVLGADVKIILENRTYWNNSKNWSSFIQKVDWSPVQVQSDEQLGTNFVHAKTFVTDDTVVISTANLWYQWFRNNREYRFETSDDLVVENIKRLHQQDREDKTIHPVDIHPAIRFCPVNCRKKLTKMISSATASIVIQAQYLEDPLLIQQLLKKQDAWVNVRIIVWKNQERDDVLSFEHIRIQTNPYLHAKNIMIDGKELLITSMNLSTNAIENNREIGIVTADKKALWSFSHQFEKDYEGASEL